MAAPNIVAVTTITPNTLSITPADTSRNALVVRFACFIIHPARHALCEMARALFWCCV